MANRALRQARALWPDCEGLGCTRPKVGAAFDEAGFPVLVNVSREAVMEGWTALYEQDPRAAKALLLEAGAQVDLRSLRAVFS